MAATVGPTGLTVSRRRRSLYAVLLAVLLADASRGLRFACWPRIARVIPAAVRTSPWRLFRRQRSHVAKILLHLSAGDASGAFPEDVWLLPPLETLQPFRASGSEPMILPCFPRCGNHLAMPGMQRKMWISQPRYIAMYRDMLAAGQSSFVMPRRLDNANGTRLAKAAVVMSLTELKDAPDNARFRYICTHNVTGRVQLTGVLNPEASNDESTYLKAACEVLSDTDAGINRRSEENELLEALGTVASLRTRAGDPLRRFELSHDSHGQPFLVDNHLLPSVTEEALQMASADRNGFWHLATLWQGYCERRAISLRQAQDRARAGSAEHVEELRKAYAAEAEVLSAATADLLQRLLQADSHGTRLAALKAVATADANRLAAAIAVQEAVGAEPFA